MTKKKMQRKTHIPYYTSVQDVRTGDVVQLEWIDTYQQTQLSPEQIAELDDEKVTIVWGVVLRHTNNSVIIATELGQVDATNTDIEQIPHAMIQRAKVLDHIEVWQ